MAVSIPFKRESGSQGICKGSISVSEFYQVSIPFKRESGSQGIEGKDSGGKHGTFQFPSNGKADRKDEMTLEAFSEVLEFQFPSNGKADRKSLDPNTPISIIEIVSIPFKRESGSQESRTKVVDRTVYRIVSIPFKRESGSQGTNTSTAFSLQ